MKQFNNLTMSQKTISLLLIFSLLLPAVACAEEKEIKSTSPDSFVEYFYDRYAEHFDEHGLIFKTPGYGVDEFSHPNDARQIISLGLYYKYRALRGDREAREILRSSILDAAQESNSRGWYTQSFSDAFAQLAIMSLLDQVPFLLSQEEINIIQVDILSRAETGIRAPDTSNRAALSAVYWQYIVDNFLRKELITPGRHNELSQLIYAKIKNVLASDVDEYGWYTEGEPRGFNPHYHMITAFAFLAYYEATGDIEFYLAAKQMTENLRAVSFDNGMVEAMIGSRPVGSGAQFYLGAGLLNCRFNYSDCGTYFNYASGDRFFSDPDYPNRLEYHSTLAGHVPDYHDDISFSNLAELSLLIPGFRQLDITLTENLTNLPNNSKGDNISVINKDNKIYINNKIFTLINHKTKLSYE